MRNRALFIFFTVLIVLTAIAVSFHLEYGNKENMGLFLVTALTAIGTCGVTILNVFPYKHKDKLEAVLYRTKKEIRLDITNKGNHRIYLGSDEYPISECGDSYAVCWPANEKRTSENTRAFFAYPGDNLTIPARSTIWFPINPKVFGRYKPNKLKIQVLTSSGYRFDVINKL